MLPKGGPADGIVQQNYQAFRESYRGSFRHLVEAFPADGPVEEAIQWMLQVDAALRTEIDAQFWIDDLDRELRQGQTLAPAQDLPDE